jgi:hypothetical protein
VNRRLRHPASHGRADANQPAIVRAIQALGHPVLDLHGVGGGVEDLLVPVAVTLDQLQPLRPGSPRVRVWMPVECKVPPIRYTAQQQAWRELTRHWPRLTVTSGQDAVDQLRELAG